MSQNLNTSWHGEIIIPLQKKGDKMECDNYRGILHLNTAYKLFSNILLKRLLTYVDENIDNYHCGFKRVKSTIDQLSIIRKIIEKMYEYRQNVWQLFIDFKKCVRQRS